MYGPPLIRPIFHCKWCGLIRVGLLYKIILVSIRLIMYFNGGGEGHDFLPYHCVYLHVAAIS